MIKFVRGEKEKRKEEETTQAVGPDRQSSDRPTYARGIRSYNTSDPRERWRQEYCPNSQNQLLLFSYLRNKNWWPARRTSDSSIS